MEIAQEQYKMFQEFMHFMNSKEINKKEYKKTRRKKGSGSIVNLGKKRNRPFLACVTSGYDEWNGKQEQVSLAYFETRDQAEKFLDLYMLEKNGNTKIGTSYQYCLSVNATFPKRNILEEMLNKTTNKENVLKLNIPTWNDLFLAVFDEQWKNKSFNTQQSYLSANNSWEKLHDVAINNITLKMLEDVFNRYKFEKLSSQSKQTNLKIVATSIFNYAIKHDYIEKNYASFLKIEDLRKSKRLKESFSKEDIQKFMNDGTMLSKFIIIMCYTGLRPSELLEINKENIDFERGIMVGGKKTKNSINRHIPIHSSVAGYLREFINSKYYHAEYSRVRKEFIELQAKLNIKHNTYMHSGRHTFASLSAEFGIKDIVIKKIMGHSTNDLTKDVYIHISDEMLLEEIKKIPKLI